MKVLCVNSSPRPNGNTRYLTSVFEEKMIEKGHDVQVLDATKMKIDRCIGCGHCEKKGVCIFKDDFTNIFLPAVIEADIVVLSSPVYFYGFPADVKALIDRIQVLWSRKYRLKTDEFKGRERRGVLLAIGATGGKDLFIGMEQTARYFFDAAGIKYEASLCYRNIDEKGEMKKHPHVELDIENLIEKLVG